MQVVAVKGEASGRERRGANAKEDEKFNAKEKGGNQRHGRWAAPCSMELTGRGGRRIKFRWNFQKSRQLWSFLAYEAEETRRTKTDQEGP